MVWQLDVLVAFCVTPFRKKEREKEKGIVFVPPQI